jgi:serine protease Do
MNALRVVLLLGAASAPLHAVQRQADPLAGAQLAMAKLYGAGQIAGLEGYQSGFFLEGEPARVVTIDSAVLDGATVTVVDAYGERYEGRVVGRDASSGLVLVECPEGIEPPSAFRLSEASSFRVTQRVWALSNCFGIAAGDEPVTLQRGRIAAITSMPSMMGDDARPTLGAPEPGSTVVVLTAVTSNPGAGGGAVIDGAGRLVGVIGAECRSPETGAWLNYALPADAASGAIQRILDRNDDPLADLPMSETRPRDVLRRVGLGLIPAIANRTPAYVERVDASGLAARAGVEPDDLIVAVDGATVGTVDAASAAIQRGLARHGAVELTVLRDDRLVTLTLQGDTR